MYLDISSGKRGNAMVSQWRSDSNQIGSTDAIWARAQDLVYFSAVEFVDKVNGWCDPNPELAYFFAVRASENCCGVSCDAHDFLLAMISQSVGIHIRVSFLAISGVTCVHRQTKYCMPDVV